MSDALIINSTPNEVRVALLENGAPAELYVERRGAAGVVGNIYRGKVVRVLPGMQAAFVDIGLERTAFLSVNDASPQPLQPRAAAKTANQKTARARPGSGKVPEPSAEPGEPGQEASSDPGLSDSSGPGLDAGSEPGLDSGSEPGLDATSEPGLNATSEPGLNATSEPGLNATSEPGLNATSEPGLDASSGLELGVSSEPGMDGCSEPETDATGATPQRGFRSAPLANIADLVKAGQDIVVQVQKEPLGTKGARITRQVTLAGRFLVFMPFSSHIGISHRIDDAAAAQGLREILQAAAQPGCGLIARTVALGIDAATLQREAQRLAKTWAAVAARLASGPTPALLHSELDLVLRATRELYSDAVAHVWVDAADDYRRVRDFVASISPGQEHRVQLYDGPQPIFDQHHIEADLQKALERRVWLKSGGYLIIDQAEALTVVDVNSGRYVGKSNLEDTIIQINLEAVQEVARQLRLRNIGGIVIVDFIDMALGSNRTKVLEALAQALLRDKAKTTLVRMSEIGLVELTRKRVRDSLGHVMCEPCAYCQGRGFTKTVRTMAQEVLRAVSRHLAQGAVPTPQILLNVQPQVADYLFRRGQADMERLESTYATRLVPVGRDGYHRERFEIN
jgi:ribonuclease G